jgi:hypothetical protein
MQPPWPDHAVIVDLDNNLVRTHGLDIDVDEKVPTRTLVSWTVQ